MGVVAGTGQYTITIINQAGTAGTVSSGTESSLNSGTDIETKEQNQNNEKSAITGAATKLGKSVIEQVLISPLNQVTGGLASPAFRLAKGLATGASAGIIGGAVAGLAIAGVMAIVQKVQTDIANLKAEATKQNNADNLLIRSGSLDLSGSTITIGKWGRQEYKYNRS